MLTVNKLCEKIHRARYELARNTTISTASVVVVLSHESYAELMSDRSIPMFPRTDGGRDVKILGAEVIVSPDLKPGTCKIMVEL